MVYIPPKYPDAIPSIEDLPNRQDDVDWLVAARYNELKKELRAALIELGTLPKGEYADVKTRLDAGVAGYADRGDPATYDFITGNFTTDGTWYDLDLSGIVPAGAKAVLLNVVIQDDLVGMPLDFRKNGNTNLTAIASLKTLIANVTVSKVIVVSCDSNRKIEYSAGAVVWTYITATVLGWWF